MCSKRIKIDLLKSVKGFAITLVIGAFMLLAIGILITFFSPENFLTRLVRDFYANCVTSLISIGIGVLVIDELRQKYSNETEKKMLISQMASPHNILATDAIRIIRDKGWIGELSGETFWYANLENAELYEANLSGSNLTYANLRNANLNQAVLDNATLVEANLSSARLNDAKLRKAKFISEHSGQFMLKDGDLLQADLTGAIFKGIASGNWMDDEQHVQLQEARRLVNAIMPNGNKYDGRYNLQGDITFAKNQGYDNNNAQSMASFYDVSLQDFENGQEWYRQFGKSQADMIGWA
jgi:hypothetical protein